MADPSARLNAALEGRYAIERELGEGGMATVYLANDLRHERKVALKVLKPELAAVVGAERFLAEIKTTANLQHPHILPLFDSGETDSFLFYVMPFVEGETLRDRINREHQLPVDDAVRIATNVAEALDYAHRKGVIHRDIKPANILLQDGKPVISDFGIALAVGVAGGGRLTETGLSVGTPHYMSPEQATGDQMVGAATDIYALGAVLYEMLIGDPPYLGSTAQAILGKIIAGKTASATEERTSVPANVDAAIRKALEKLPADRFTGAQEFAGALADPGFRHGELGEAAVAAGAGPWNRLTMATTTLAALFAVTTLVFGWSLLRPEPPGPVARFGSPFQEGQFPVPLAVNAMAFTADGSALVYSGPGASVQERQLWLRRWADLDAAPIRGTEGGASPVLSPDQREVAFIGRGEVLQVAPLDGGPSRTLVDHAAGVGSWTSDGFVYYRVNLPEGGLARIPATGGGSEAVERLTELQGAALHSQITVLPGGDMAVFLLNRSLLGGGGEVWSIDLETRERSFLTAGATPRYVSTGHLLFTTPDRVLMAQRIDPATAELTGPAIPVAEDLRLTLDNATLAVSESGTLIYAAGGANVGFEGLLEPVWVTRSGEARPVDPNWQLGLLSVLTSGLSLSPDGARVAVMRVVDGNADIWIKQLPDGPLERLTSEDGIDASPFWSPDGAFVAYMRDGNIWQSRADGTGSPELVLDDERGLSEGRWSPDGEWMILRTSSSDAGVFAPDNDILGFPPGVDSAAIPLVASPEFSELSPALSPNGRWLAYTSDRTGQREVYVRPFPNVDSTRVTVSRAGGRTPLWAHSGSELFFVDGELGLVVAEVQADSVFRVLRSATLFNTQSEFVIFSEGVHHYANGPDDEQFLMLRGTGALSGDSGGDTRFVLVQNWFEELRERMGN